MSVAAEVVRIVVMLSVGAGMMALYPQVNRVIARAIKIGREWKVSIRLWFGSMVLCAGLWVIKFGCRIAEVQVSMQFPGVSDEQA